MNRTHGRKRSRSDSRTGCSRSNQESTENIQSSDPSSDGNTANEIATKVEARFKRIKEDSIKAGRSMELIRTNVHGQLDEQRKEIEQLRRSIANRDEELDKLEKEIKELLTQLSKVNEMLTSKLITVVISI